MTKASMGMAAFLAYPAEAWWTRAHCSQGKGLVTSSLPFTQPRGDVKLGGCLETFESRFESSIEFAETKKLLNSR